MAINCRENTATVLTRHRSLIISWETLAMTFTILLVSSQTITITVGKPILPENLSTNSTNVSSGTANATNTTSLCAEVKCEPGLECVISEGNASICVSDPNYDCSGMVSDPECGSDGLTYDNECERNKKGVQLKNKGSCFSCQDQASMYSANSSVRRQLVRKCKTLTSNDVMASNMFLPKCSEEDPDVFLPDQALDTIGATCKYYWCSTPDGVVIGDTFSRTVPHCSGRSGCTDDGHKYKDGEVFKPKSCGVCECLDGEIKCINDFCGVRGNLTAAQLDILKSDIYQLFYFQFQFSDHILIDLHHIRNNPAKKDSESIACSVLNWKFTHYDRNEDNELQPNEQHIFVDEVHDIINFAGFDEQMRAQIDTNQDKIFSFSEWFTYFTSDVTEGSSGTSVQWSCERSSNSR